MDYWANVANIVLIFSILGISLNLVLGYSGMVSLAHAVYFGIAAYIVALLSIHNVFSPLPPALIAVVATGLFAALTAFPALRVRDEYLILLTLALQMIASGIMNSWLGVTNGPSGIPGIPPLDIAGYELFSPMQLLPVIAVSTLLIFLFARRIGASAFGRVLKAIRENESAAVALGKNIVAQKVIVFGISGALAGIAGALFAREQGFINPLSFSLDASILIVALVALGGAANLYGTVVGALLLLGAPELLTFLDIGSAETVSASRGVIFGLLLILFARFRPQGMIPEHAAPGGRRSRIAVVDKTGEQGAGPAAAGAPAAGDGPAQALEVRGLNKRFGGIVTARDISITLEFGKVTALIGPNGAGKTTVFNLLAGAVRPDSGRIVVHGRDLTGVAAWRRVYAGLGRSFQDVRLFEHMPVIDNVLVALPRQPGENIVNLFFRVRHTGNAEKANRRRALQLLRQVGLEDKACELAGDLSYGEQKLLAVARLIATGADVLLFDEPAAGVDESWARKMLDLIRALADSGKAVCLVEHNLSIVCELADTVYFMDAGTIMAEGTPEEIMRDPRLADLYFGQAVTGS